MTKLPCLHGWHVACLRCEAMAAALGRRFDRAVAAGTCNARGYTPAEWAARRVAPISKRNVRSLYAYKTRQKIKNKDQNRARQRAQEKSIEFSPVVSTQHE